MSEAKKIAELSDLIRNKMNAHGELHLDAVYTQDLIGQVVKYETYLAKYEEMITSYQDIIRDLSEKAKG